MQKNLYASKVGHVIRSITGLFVTPKTNITFKNHKDIYFSHYYFPQKLCAGIDIISKTERISKREAAVMLMEAGLSSYMGSKIRESIRANRAAQEKGEKAVRSRFIFVLRKVARAQGIDISKFI